MKDDTAATVFICLRWKEREGKEVTNAVPGEREIQALSLGLHLAGQQIQS